MNNAQKSFWFSRLFAICPCFSALVAVGMFFVSIAHANTLSWSGAGGADATWGNSANWGFAGTPGNGDTLIFRASSPNLVNTNNIAGLTLNQIIFVGAGGGYDIRGDAFTLTNNILVTNTVGGNTIENNITLTGNIQVAVSNNVSLTLACVLSGTGGVNKTGLGPLTYQAPGFPGNNTYTGTTLVSAGTLQFNVSGPTAVSGPLVIGDGSGANNPQVADLQSFEMENTGPITINLNGELFLDGFSETVNVTTNFMLNGGGIGTLGGTLGLSPNTTFNTGSNNSTVIDGNLDIGTGTLTIQGNGLYVEFPANVSGAANIVQNDSVSTLWYGFNTYTGNYTANGDGIVEIGSSQALGNTNNSMTLNGQSEVIFVSDSDVTNQSLTVNSSYLYGWGAVDAFFASTNSWQAGNFTFNASNPLLIDTNCYLNLIGPISGPASLTKYGGGILTFSGTTANTYAGSTTVSNGTLLLGKTYATIAVPGPLVIESNATVRLLNSFQIDNPTTPVTMFDTSLFDLAGFNEWVGATTLQGARITSGAGTFYFNSNITVNASTVAQSLISGNASIWAGTYSITNSGHYFSPDLLISANLSGQGLIKDGGGEVSLSGNNSFVGPVTINNGNLWAQSSTALGNTNTPATVNNGGVLFLDGVGLDFGLKPLVLNGGTGFGIGSLLCNGSSSWEGNVTLNADSMISPYTSSSLTVTGAISGVGGIIMAGPGTLTYAGSNANTYAGLTTVNGGTLLLNKAYGANAVPGNLVVTGGSSVARLGNSLQLPDADVLVTNGGLFDFASYADYINTLRGNGTVNFGLNGYLVIGNINGSSEFDGPMTGTGYTFGGYTVGKFGTGTFTLGGNNTFSSGAYHVFSPGRLLVNGSSPKIPAIVDSGAILGGGGSVGIITGNGTVSPGDGPPGILTSSNLNFSSTGFFTPVLTGPNAGVGGYSQLIVTGAVSLASAKLAVEPAFATPPSIGQQFTIIKNDGGSPVSGTFNGLINGAQFNSGGYFFRINYNGGAGNDVVLTLIGSPQETITLNAVDTGWYDSTGFHDSSNPNYYAGQNSILTDTNLYRNFFVFNAPVSSYSIISAELIVNDYFCGSPNGRETYVLYDVTNAISTVEAGGSGLTNIYNDLGSGSVYGIRTVSTNETGERAIIPLNYGFINDLAAAAGGQIALGGAITTLAPTNGHNQYLFSSSEGFPTDVQLRVTYGTSIITNAIAQGWYNSLGSHGAANPNYVAGIFVPDTNVYRDFFVFNVPPFPGQAVSAELWVNLFNNTSPFGVNTYQLHSVSTPIITLTNDASGATSTYADLGDGTYYGGRDVYVTESNHVIGIPLNNAFISAATNSGGSIALGGIVSSLTMASTNEYVFGSSTGPATNVELWLGFFASPQSAPSFTGGTPTYLGNNEYQIMLSGTTSTTNEIRSTFDFTNWDYISDVVVPGATTTFYYTNGNFTVPYRFFRARVMP